MKLSFGTDVLEHATHQTEEQLKHALMQCELGSLLLGVEAEQKTLFVSLTLIKEWIGSASRRFGIGLCCEGHGLVPHLLLRPSEEALLLGFNSEVAAVSTKSFSCLFSLRLESLFSAFLAQPRQEFILVFHEIGVVAMRTNGNVLWSFSRDVITDVRVEGDYLHLSFMDEHAATLSMSDGRLLG